MEEIVQIQHQCMVEMIAMDLHKILHHALHVRNTYIFIFWFNFIRDRLLSILLGSNPHVAKVYNDAILFLVVFLIQFNLIELNLIC